MQALITIDKSFVRPHLDYSGIIYDQPKDDTSCNLIDKLQ